MGLEPERVALDPLHHLAGRDPGRFTFWQQITYTITVAATA
jgi:hypothetical protein